MLGPPARGWTASVSTGPVREEAGVWIQSIAPSEAVGELKDMYDRIGGARGGVAQIHQAQ